MGESMRYLSALLLWSLCSLALPAMAGTLDDSLQVAREINDQGAASQKTVDKLAAKTQSLLEEYQQLMLDSDFHATRKQQLLLALEQQQGKQQQLQQALDQIQVTEKRLAPLLLSMVQALEQFVVADLPFHHPERIDAVLLLRERILDPGLSLADRFQLMMEAFQVELDYSYNLEAYRTQIQWQGETRSVECLRVGRLALYFVTPDGSEAGFWHSQQQQWQPLPQEIARSAMAGILDGIKVAQGRVAPELLPLPLVTEWHP